MRGSEFAYRRAHSPIKFVLIDHNFCMGSGVGHFQAPFCVYTMFLNEIPELSPASNDRQEEGNRLDLEQITFLISNRHREEQEGPWQRGLRERSPQFKIRELKLNEIWATDIINHGLS